MPEIKLKTDTPKKAEIVIFEALETEAKKITYSLNLSKKHLERFEKKYNISSDKFIADWSAEDLDGKDMEYIEWAGEYHLAKRLDERLLTLKSIENATS